MRCLIILLLSPFMCFAQQDLHETNTIVKFNLTSPIEMVSFPTLQLSVEKKIYGGFSVLGEFGYQLYHQSDWTNNHDTDTLFTKTRGIKTNLEGRVYLQKSKRLTLSGLYVGLRLFYWQNKYNETLSYSPITDTTQLIDRFWVKKKNWGINAVVGYQKNAGKHFLFDFSMAVGGMNRAATNFNREYSSNDFELNQPRHPNIWAIRRQAGLSENSGWLGSVNLTVRLGYRF